MYCRFCGEQVPDDTRFCPNCYNPCGFENPTVTQNVSNNQRIRGNNHKSQMNTSDSYSPYAPVNNRPFYQSNMYVNPRNSKYCKGCHNMIDKRSKRCHICGKKQGFNIGAILCIPFLFMFMLIFVIGISSSPSNNVTSEIITLGGNFDESGKVYIYMNGDNSEYREGIKQDNGFVGNCFYRLPAGKYKIVEVSEKGCVIYSIDNSSDSVGFIGSLCSDSSINGKWVFDLIVLTYAWGRASTSEAGSLDSPITVNSTDLFLLEDGYIKLKKVD